MRFDNRKWIIINVSNITDEMISSAIQTSKDTLRKTTDGTKAILKWDGDTPEVFDGMTTYNHSQILAILNDVNGDWYSDN